MTKAWAEFDLQIPALARAIFESATAVVVANDERALFWKDRWLQGARVVDHAPNLVAMIPARKAKVRSVKDVLAGEWLRDCGPDISPAAVAEFFHLWGILAGYTLVPEQEDAFVWRWSADWFFSAKSAYSAFFAGTVVAPISSEIWRSRAPYSCKFFAWLVSRNRCWTADRLQRRGLPRPAACPLCDQDQETLQHLLLGCVVSREVWAWVLARWGKLEWMPGVDTEVVPWWSSLSCTRSVRRDMWTAIILVFWCIWRHRNEVVFNGATPAAAAIRHRIREEYQRWRVARLFRSESFGFPEPFPFSWRDGD
jgi:hypothetical protein